MKLRDYNGGASCKKAVEPGPVIAANGDIVSVRVGAIACL